MKKTVLKLGVAAAMLTSGLAGINATGSNASNETSISATQKGTDASQGNQQNNPAQEQGESFIRSQRYTGADGYNPMNYFRDAGTPPKEWGQYLQRTGKQKWTKKRKYC